MGGGGVAFFVFCSLLPLPVFVRGAPCLALSLQTAPLAVMGGSSEALTSAFSWPWVPAAPRLRGAAQDGAALLPVSPFFFPPPPSPLSLKVLIGKS